MNNYSDLEKQKEKTLQLAAGLDEIADIVGHRLGLSTQMDDLHRRAESLRNGRFRIVVIGDFDNGKSTLLNAVLGARILPQSFTPSTAIISVIEYADTPQVRVKFLDGREDELLSLDDFRGRYILNEEDWDGNCTVTDRFTAVDLAVVSYPVELCRQHVELVDSPGLQDDPVRTKRTVEFLKHADAVVMVLDATKLLLLSERRFLENELKQHGLKNIFFVINKWNVLNLMLPPSQVDRDGQFKKLETRIHDHLTPFCVVDGHDLSGDRVFRINALGALEARETRPVDQAALAESMVSAFEQAMQRFLVQGRGRARLDVVLAALKAIDQEVLRFIATQVALSDKSVAEIESERVALEPKLERLRGIRRHIENFLDAQSINLQERMVLAFQAELKNIVDDLPEAMKTFELEKLTDGSMLWKAVTDWAHSDEQKFKAKVERHLTPRVTNYLQARFARWQESVVSNEIKAVSVDIERHLNEEAKEYRRVVSEIEERLGIAGSTLQIEETVRHWLNGGRGSENDSTLGPDLTNVAIGVLGEMSWVVSSIVIEVVGHLTVVWLPIIGALVTAFRLVMKEMTIREDMQKGIQKGIAEKLDELKQPRSVTIREEIRRDFDGLKAKIAGSIGEEVGLIDASLQAIIDRKKQTQFDAGEEQRRLEDTRAELQAAVGRLQLAVL